jgi:hypothetical protein
MCDLACALEKSWRHFFRHIRATIGFDAAIAQAALPTTFTASRNFTFLSGKPIYLRRSWLSTTPAQALTWAGSSRPGQLSGICRRLGNLEESKKALDSFTRLDQENNELENTRRNMSKTRSAPHPGGERAQ